VRPSLSCRYGFGGIPAGGQGRLGTLQRLDAGAVLLLPPCKGAFKRFRDAGQKIAAVSPMDSGVFPGEFIAVFSVQ
jgi:hypothetical protein